MCMNDLIEQSKAESIRLLRHTLRTIDKMVEEGREVSYVTVAREAQVSRQYLYRHPEIKEKIKVVNEIVPKTNKVSIEKNIETKDKAKGTETLINICTCASTGIIFITRTFPFSA